MEMDRRKNLLVILRDNRTGAERSFPWNQTVLSRVRYYAEVAVEW
jgi:hypothetical protein